MNPRKRNTSTDDLDSELDSIVKRAYSGPVYQTNNFRLMYPVSNENADIIEQNPAAAKLMMDYFDDLCPFMLTSDQLVQLSQLGGRHHSFELLAKNAVFFHQVLGITNAGFMAMVTSPSDTAQAIVESGSLFLSLGYSAQDLLKMASRGTSVALTLKTLSELHQELTTTFQLTKTDIVWLASKQGVVSTIAFIFENKNRLIELGYVGDKFRELFSFATHKKCFKHISEILGLAVSVPTKRITRKLIPIPTSMPTTVAPAITLAPKAVTAPTPATVTSRPASHATKLVDFQSASTTMFSAPVVKPEPVAELEDSEITQRIYDAIRVLRGSSDATHNCGHLAGDLLRYFRGYGFPTAPSLTTPCTVDDSGVYRTVGTETIQVKKEPGSSRASTAMIDSVVKASSSSRITFFQKVGAPLAQHYPHAIFVEKPGTQSTSDTKLVEQYNAEDQLLVNADEYDKYPAFITDINARLISLADARPDKILCGSISFAPANKGASNNSPGHVIPFYVANNRVWFVDGQFLVYGLESAARPAVFHDLSKAYSFATDAKSTNFSPRVFFLPFDAAILMPAPQREQPAKVRGNFFDL